jgi:hypothetical protein
MMTLTQPLETTAVSRPAKPACVIPAKAGIQPWDTTNHDISREAAESGESKPCSVVVFWMLAFASMTHVRKARPVFRFAARQENSQILESF